MKHWNASVAEHNQLLLPDRIKLDLCFDPALLQRDLERLQGDEWIAHFVTQNYAGDWSVIPLRGMAHATHPVMMIYSDPACTEFADTPFLDRTPYFREVLETFQCPLTSVRLMKLSPGSRIKAHRDHDLSVEAGTARLHIPIVTNEQVKFVLNGERVVLNEGECWYLRLSDLHSVENNGITERVHLVVDAVVVGYAGWWVMPGSRIWTQKSPEPVKIQGFMFLLDHLRF
ncbi:MAG: aspartyl/asparaginyl beta-hydroxylase domain-containing protein [Thiolinea sp.]